MCLTDIWDDGNGLPVFRRNSLNKKGVLNLSNINKKLIFQKFKMSAKTLKNPQKRNFKEVNTYKDALEIRLEKMESIIYNLKLDPKAIEENEKLRHKIHKRW